MFQSLDEQIRADENREGSNARRMLLYDALAGVGVCFGLIYAINLLSG